MENLNFGQALEALKQSKKVAREGWNGKNMFLFYNNGLQNAIGLRARQENFIKEILDVCPFLVIKTADDKLVPWLASQTDVLAEDWVIVN